MWKRRLIYLLILLSSYIFFLFYRMWFAWYLLLLVIILPIMSFIVALVSFMKLKPVSIMPSELRHKELADLVIGNDTLLKEKKIRIKEDESFFYMNYDSVFEVYDYLENKTALISYPSKGMRDYKVPLNTEHIGSFTYTFKNIKFYDFFGLFCFKKKVGNKHELQIRPRPLTPAVMPKLDNYRTRSLRKSKSQYSEIYDIRDYQPGDSTKNIHWKMSAKKDNVLVREPLEENMENARLVFELPSDKSRFDQRLSEQYFVSKYFIDRKVTHRLNVVPPYNHSVFFEIYSNDDIEKMVTSMIHMQLPVKDKRSEKEVSDLIENSSVASGDAETSKNAEASEASKESGEKTSAKAGKEEVSNA